MNKLKNITLCVLLFLIFGIASLSFLSKMLSSYSNNKNFYQKEKIKLQLQLKEIIEIKKIVESDPFFKSVPAVRNLYLNKDIESETRSALLNDLSNRQLELEREASIPTLFISIQTLLWSLLALIFTSATTQIVNLSVERLYNYLFK